ncbi:HPF/RaiA family ribosome-associated protein [Fluoribacter dumoffii]|uniref:Ribosomal subunit interface protein n=1 Tax=Fluoribacter dumoffii TaxID=463 RepID=A0A377G9D3_9GAMM|nr:HPF/RaiA family ribosome-associated protein [Fluoribacter dumoffii]KTC90297.1 sigma 54 modulation protein YhbH [Fluoribacter dumoffii NY 23]MCW8385615.1 HPF/RaiA family ribosome-associated protein [Fluoribacter dumoffii]MCW8418643.1 HPF/RaiA family ribosome-associated protein [Fluoribacter dumoffii]MCW8453513.1 HPF/RaiA family ribosome-associated protein [Fluoribacter dumoffii]MCW8459268.1 HPF/RaiA family ribosome-associated protein [Fluoribacter dumoffii]
MNNSVHFPIQIIFNNLRRSRSLESNVRNHAEKLGKYFDRIMSCKVCIETHRHHYKGKIYHVRIDIIVPNAELVANRDLADNHAHEDVYVAIRDAFLAMTRQIKKYADKQRGEVKYHELPPEGRIREIAPLADYGFIETLDGRRLRFTSKSVIDYDFSKLEVGERVTFVEAKSNDGPAASTVYVK